MSDQPHLRFVVLAFALSLPACASIAPAASDLKRVPIGRQYQPSRIAEPGDARVAFIRDVGPLAGLVNVHITIDGVRVASLAPGEYVTINVSPGERQIEALVGSSFDHKPFVLDVLLKRDQAVVYRIGFEPGGFAPPRMSFNRDRVAPFPGDAFGTVTPGAPQGSKREQHPI